MSEIISGSITVFKQGSRIFNSTNLVAGYTDEYCDKEALNIT